MQNFFRLENVNQGTAKNNGSKYLSGYLCRFNKRITFRLFGAKDTDIEKLTNGVCIELIHMENNKYNGENQILIKNYRLLNPDEIVGTGLIPESVYPSEELQIKFNKIVNLLSNDYIAVVDHIKKQDFWQKFITIPAARNMHHAYQRGLLEHSLSVADLVLKLSENIPVNRNVLVFSALFHDIAKTFEFITNRTTNLVESYSADGQLLGHLYISAEIIGDLCKERIPEEDIQNIKHCLLSHHGKPEWGSAIVPKTIEAYILHTADNFDSDTNAMLKAFQESIDEFVHIRSLDRMMKNASNGEEDEDK